MSSARIRRPSKPTPNERLLRARLLLDKGDVGGAVPVLSQLADVPELAAGAAWLAASLAATTPATRAESARMLRELIERGDGAAGLALLSRAIELQDRETIGEAVHGPSPLSSAERMTLAALAGIAVTPGDAHMEATVATPGMLPLAAALAALGTVAAGDDRAAQVRTRAYRTAGSDESRALVALGRLLGSSGASVDVESALASLGGHPSAGARALALEMAARAGRTLEVSRALEAWGNARGSGEEHAAGAMAAAMVAERGGETVRALEALRAARAADPTNEAALRAIASLEQVDLVAELNTLADELGEGVRGAVARIEAVSRGEGALPEPTRAELLERAHRAAPGLPLAAFLAERIARHAGDAEETLRWIRERRAATTDSVEAALDGVREGLLLLERDPALATERLHDAHRARPGDVALRELLERASREPLDDGAAWREGRASDAGGDARTLLFLDASREYERAGDEAGALRCAEAAAGSESGLGRVARERAELGAGNVSRLADELLSAAKATEDPRVRREAYERLAVLDATARQDPASALLWHRSILEEQPGHLPSLRYVEQHLVGEGRDEELEPFAVGIAQTLRGQGLRRGERPRRAGRPLAPARGRGQLGLDARARRAGGGGALPHPLVAAHARGSQPGARRRRDLPRRHAQVARAHQPPRRGRGVAGPRGRGRVQARPPRAGAVAAGARRRRRSGRRRGLGPARRRSPARRGRSRRRRGVRVARPQQLRSPSTSSWPGTTRVASGRTTRRTKTAPSSRSRPPRPSIPRTTRRSTASRGSTRRARCSPSSRACSSAGSRA